VLPDAAGVTLAGSDDDARRYLSPTSATDLQHEHPQDRLIPSLHTPCGVLCKGRRFRLTPPFQLQPALDALLIKERRFGPDRSYPAAAFSAARRARQLDL